MSAVVPGQEYQLRHVAKFRGASWLLGLTQDDCSCPRTEGSTRTWDFWSKLVTGTYPGCLHFSQERRDSILSTVDVRTVCGTNPCMISILQIFQTEREFLSMEHPKYLKAHMQSHNKPGIKNLFEHPLLLPSTYACQH